MVRKSWVIFLFCLPMDFTNYSVNDFVGDESFQAFVADADSDAGRFWQAWLAEHPAHKPAVDQAYALVQGLGPAPAVPRAGRAQAAGAAAPAPGAANFPCAPVAALAAAHPAAGGHVGGGGGGRRGLVAVAGTLPAPPRSTRPALPSRGRLPCPMARWWC